MSRRRRGRPSEPEIVESAIIAIEGILNLPILEQHKRALISGALWFITEARGKYKTRYRSLASKEVGAKLQHEHVFTRKDLTDRLMAQPERARETLKSAVACVVTAEEHKRLAVVDRQHPSLRGWERYDEANIEYEDGDANSR